MTKLIIMLMAAIMLSVTSGFSQTESGNEPSVYLKRNSVQVAGGFILLGASASGYYERIIGLKNLAFFARGGVGTFAFFGSYGNFMLLEGGIITHAKNTHHFEAALGPNYFFDKDFQGIVMPSLSAGYRLQKPDGHFIFRTGIGYFQGLYVGVGYSF